MNKVRTTAGAAAAPRAQAKGETPALCDVTTDRGRARGARRDDAVRVGARGADPRTPARPRAAYPPAWLDELRLEDANVGHAVAEREGAELSVRARFVDILVRPAWTHSAPAPHERGAGDQTVGRFGFSRSIILAAEKRGVEMFAGGVKPPSQLPRGKGKALFVPVALRPFSVSCVVNAFH